MFLNIFHKKASFLNLRNITFSENDIFQPKKGACGKPEGTQKKLMSFFSQKKAPAASRRAHKKSFKQHQQHKNKTRTRTRHYKKSLMTLFRQNSDGTIKVALQNYNKSSTINKIYKKITKLIITLT